jgi:hypothetical protein
MKTIRQHLEDLPSPVREAAIEYYEQSSLYQQNIAVYTSTLAQALYRAFYWDNTREELEYWDSVYLAIESGRKLPPLPH